MQPLYLDHAAATPLEPAVLEAMQPFFVEKFYNPSALYLAAQDVAQHVTRAREEVAQFLGCRPIELVFTAGGTEANNLAIHGVMKAFPGKHAVVSAIEHDSVLEPMTQYPHAKAPVSAEGLVDLRQLEKAINDETVLVSVMYANNEIGTIQPIKDIARVVERIRLNRKQQGNTLPLYLHTDAAQATNYLDIHVSRLGVDLKTLNGGKVYGPKQSGALYIKSGTKLESIMQGGGQERRLRSGTENVAQIAGFAAAVRLAVELQGQEVLRLHALQQAAFDALLMRLPDCRINGSLKRRLPNNLHITLPGQDNERVIMLLDEHGIQAAAGSACSASKETSSHVLLALGMSDDDARSSLRFTMGRQTTAADINHLVDVLVAIAS
ncbi:MAG TPA: cysteine desulfurase family protein [Candidatus Limnocylindrales bacterium]|nr:cysteine desulfurase family protein [Candidatus Limnocylindrales bacterium]